MKIWGDVSDGNMGWTAIVIVVTLMNITAAGEDSCPGHDSWIMHDLQWRNAYLEVGLNRDGMKTCWWRAVWIWNHMTWIKISRSWDGMVSDGSGCCCGRYWKNNYFLVRADSGRYWVWKKSITFKEEMDLWNVLKFDVTRTGLTYLLHTVYTVCGSPTR